MARWNRVAQLLFLVVALAGCRTTRSFFGGDLTAEVLTDLEINQNSPVQLELLVIYDDTLLGQITSLTAQNWFSQRQGILRNYTSNESYLSRYWELVPGQPRFREEISFNVGARGVLIFANYKSSGDHRFRVEPHEDLLIHLGESDVAVRPLSR